MKFLFSILLSIIGSLNILANTPADSLVKAAVIVDGLFYDKSLPAKSLIPGGSTMAILKDSDGATVLGVYLPKGYVVEASLIEKAIPAERVRDAEKLLRDYNGHRPQTVADYEGVGVKVGEPMVRFEYSDIDNNLWNNDKLKDKIYVINLWQSECGPCRREMPELSEWKSKFPDVVFLSASRHNRDEILPIVEKHSFTWIHLQEATDLVALVGKDGFPLTIVVDKDAIVRYAEIGATEENQAAALAVIEELSRQ